MTAVWNQPHSCFSMHWASVNCHSKELAGQGWGWNSISSLRMFSVTGIHGFSSCALQVSPPSIGILLLVPNRGTWELCEEVETLIPDGIFVCCIHVSDVTLYSHVCTIMSIKIINQYILDHIGSTSQNMGVRRMRSVWVKLMTCHQSYVMRLICLMMKSPSKASLVLTFQLVDSFWGRHGRQESVLFASLLFAPGAKMSATFSFPQPGLGSVCVTLTHLHQLPLLFCLLYLFLKDLFFFVKRF
jgi:hypothetical protein